MPITNGYTALATAKAHLHIADTSEDGAIEDLITGCSRALDQWLGRRFYAATETRYYTALSAYRLLLDQDLRTVTTLKTDETGDRTYERTWSSSTDYYLTPDNASSDGQPYTAIEVDRANGLYVFPVGIQRGVEIAGSWGFCATGSHPPMIERACLLLVNRLYKRGDAPLGVTGSTEFGLIRIGSDRDIQDMIWPYSRRRGFA